jgi:hypothetical protein
MIYEFIKFRKDISDANPMFKIWGPLLNLSLIIGGLYFFEEEEGVLISVTTFISLIIAVKIHKVMPVSRLIGVCHVVWFPLYPFLIVKAYNEEFSYEFKYFLVWATSLMTISIIFDFYDFYRYVFTENKTYSRN